jgi:Zn-dependent protease with chaperone function
MKYVIAVLSILFTLGLSPVAMSAPSVEATYNTYNKEILKREVLVARYPIPQDIAKMYETLCTRAQACLPLIVTDYPPIARASLTRIVIDKSVLTLPANQLYALLAHELYHVKNKDISFYQTWLKAQMTTEADYVKTIRELSQLSMQRETNADLFALEMLSKSEFSLNSLEHALLAFQQKTPPSAGSHPTVSDRITTIQQAIKDQYHEQISH